MNLSQNQSAKLLSKPEIDLYLRSIENFLTRQKDIVNFPNPDIKRGYLEGVDDCIFLLKRIRHSGQEV